SAETPADARKNASDDEADGGKEDLGSRDVLRPEIGKGRRRYARQMLQSEMNPRGIMAGATRRSHGRGGRSRRGPGASPIARRASDASARDGRLGERHHFVVELAREPHKGKRQRRARCFAEPQVEVEKRPRLERLEHELMALLRGSVGEDEV